jgi:hypothetical protein
MRRDILSIEFGFAPAQNTLDFSIAYALHAQAVPPFRVNVAPSFIVAR